MRLVITNPDGIGDTVLRLPLFEALRASGHELLVIARQHAVPLLERLGDGVSVLTLRENPYEMTRRSVVDFDAALLAGVQAFRPDMLVWVPYQWTILEEWLAAALPGTAVTRMNGHRFEHENNSGIPRPPGVERVAMVAEFWHESLKNESLAEAILGRPMKLPAPSIDVSGQDIARGKACLEGLFGASVPASFWFGCMGTTGDYYGDLKDWGTPRWAELLRYLVLEKGQAVVLVGSDGERESLERVRAGSGVGERIAVSTGDAGRREDFSRLLGLAWLSRGYVGRDTGPMHLAGAVRRPVVAVFGAGMWPRFTPMATASRALAVDLPCAPCRWVCRHPESWCVKRVPLEAVKEAFDAVISGDQPLRQARLIPASPELYEAASRR